MDTKFGFLKIALYPTNQLSEDDEMSLLKKYQNGDMQAYSKLRLSLRSLVEKAIADAIPSGGQVSPSLLRMRADTHMPTILQNFDSTRDIKLKTYVLSSLKGYLRNAAAENMSGPYVPRNQHSDLYKYKQALRSAEMEFGHSPSDEQVRQFYPESETINSFDKIKQYHVNSFLGDAAYGEDEEEALTFKDQFSQNQAYDDNHAISSIFEEELKEQITNDFTPNEQEVIERVNQKGQSFVEVALSLGISTADVRKIMRRWYNLTQKN